MATFEGIVTLENDRVPVTVGIEANKVTLLAGDVPIGEWPAEECLIRDEGGGTWSIEAEDEKLSFQPEEPGRFATSLDGNDMPAPPPPPSPEPEPAPHPAGTETDVAPEPDDGPAPRSVTLVGFYALTALTGALGVWALISLFG